MPHAHVHPWPFSLGRAAAQALVLIVLPLATAYAQPYPHVRVVREGTAISTVRARKEVRMKAPQGTVLEVMHIEGDRYRHRDSNWYWVLLPPDAWGTRPVGWIRGDKVEHVPAPDPTSVPRTAVVTVPQAAPAAEVPQAQQARSEPREIVVSKPPAARDVPAARPVLSDVVLNFPFGRSELTDEAKRTLAGAVSLPVSDVQQVSVAVEGHADWTGPEGYNERLGLARAETVKRYLADQFRIPADRISIVSYGESNPAAPNTTREGRARNRRVVIKGGA